MEVPASWAVDGVSIAPFLTGGAEDTPRAWIAAAAAVWPSFASERGPANLEPYPPRPGLDKQLWPAWAMGVVVRDKRFKPWNYSRGPRALFNLRRDPREERNLWESYHPRVLGAKRRLRTAPGRSRIDFGGGVAVRPAAASRSRVAPKQVERRPAGRR